MIERRNTRQLHVGSVPVGGLAPVSVQSMTTTKTADVDGTLAQVYALAGAGADIVRITCNEVEAAQGLAEIVPRSPVPIIADIHYQYKLALAALEAGVQGLRLNPGNIRKEEQIKAVAREAKDRGVPIKISVKHSHVPSMIESYRLLADTVDYPLHLGVTEAGPPPSGLIKSVAGIATLLNEGIGDTIRFSLTADPVEEAKAGRQLLEFLGLRERKGLDLIACPSCGRAEVDVIEVTTKAQAALEAANLPIQVAVMGCVVNGPGEAREADIGIAAGRGKGHLFIKGQVVRVVPEAEMVDALLDEAKKLVEEGVESRLAHAEANAEEIAKDTRQQLVEIQGDANRAEDRRRRVAEVAQSD